MNNRLLILLLLAILALVLVFRYAPEGQRQVVYRYDYEF